MSSIQDPTKAVAPPVDAPPTALAAFLLVAVALLEWLDLERPTKSEVIEKLGVGRTRAYDLRARVQALLSALVAPSGRPPIAPPTSAPSALATQALAFLRDHPGALAGSATRTVYSRDYRLFVLELVEVNPDVTHQALAEAVCVALPTLNEWLRCEVPDIGSEPEPEIDAQRAPLTARETHFASVLDAWKLWDGPFGPFCEHVRRDLHLSFGRTLISSILRIHGARFPEQRSGRSPDEHALRDSCETFFSNAQWVGDGSELAIAINGQRFVCNLELIVDPHTGAFVGADVRTTEDADAVVAAFEDAQESTGETPIALLLDNKPSNHVPEVIDATAPALVTRATPFRPQNKAHVEGGFGLLKPTLGEPHIVADTPDELAQAIIALLVTVWARTINHRPRRDRGGRTRAHLLKDAHTPEQAINARERLLEIHQQHERARETQAARQDPVVRAYITEAIAELTLEDPGGNVLTAIARYPLTVIVDAVGIFAGRQRSGSLPKGVDVRYLLGITRNIAQDREAWAITGALWEERLRARDITLRHHQEKRDAIDAHAPDRDEAVAAYLDEALATPWLPERTFWLRAAADLIAAAPTAEHEVLYRRAARRIQATYILPNRERQGAIRILAERLLPLR